MQTSFDPSCTCKLLSVHDVKEKQMYPISYDQKSDNLVL